MNLVLHADAAEGFARLPDGTIKLVYGSSPYPNVRRRYGTWTGEQWLEMMKHHLAAAVPKLRLDGFLALNVKAGREPAARGQLSYRRRWVERLLIWVEDELGLWAVDDEIWNKSNGVPRGPRCCASDAWEPIYLWARSNPWQLNLDQLRRPYAAGTLDRYRRDYRPDLSGRPVYHRQKRVAPHPLGALPTNVLTVPVGGPKRASAHESRQPEDVPRRYVLACTDPGQLVWDPWMGSGNTLVVAKTLGRLYGGTDTEADYVAAVQSQLDRTYCTCEGVAI